MKKNFTQADVFKSTESSKVASINGIVNDFAEYLQEYDTEFEKVQSPLEGAYLASLLKENFTHSIVGWLLDRYGYQFNIESQYEVNYGDIKYYPDFCLSIVDTNREKTIYQIFVEIDGHEFHEKTKEQVRHDKLRERHLLENCDGIVRFSGSEVYDDPNECAYETLELMAKKFSNELIKLGVLRKEN